MSSSAETTKAPVSAPTTSVSNATIQTKREKNLHSDDSPGIHSAAKCDKMQQQPKDTPKKREDHGKNVQHKNKHKKQIQKKKVNDSNGRTKHMDPLTLLRELLQKKKGHTCQLSELGSLVQKHTKSSWKRLFEETHGKMSAFIRTNQHDFRLQRGSVRLLKHKPKKPAADAKGWINVGVSNASTTVADDGGAGKKKKSETKNKKTSKRQTDTHLQEQWGSWYRFNDSTVTPLSIFGIEEQFLGKENAYMLFYRRIAATGNIAVPDDNEVNGDEISHGKTMLDSPAASFEDQRVITSHKAVPNAKLSAKDILMGKLSSHLEKPTPPLLIRVPPFWDKYIETRNKNLSMRRDLYDRLSNQIRVTVYAPECFEVCADNMRCCLMGKSTSTSPSALPNTNKTADQDTGKKDGGQNIHLSVDARIGIHALKALISEKADNKQNQQMDIAKCHFLHHVNTKRPEDGFYIGKPYDGDGSFVDATEPSAGSGGKDTESKSKSNNNERAKNDICKITKQLQDGSNLLMLRTPSSSSSSNTDAGILDTALLDALSEMKHEAHVLNFVQIYEKKREILLRILQAKAEALQMAQTAMDEANGIVKEEQQENCVDKETKCSETRCNPVKTSETQESNRPVKDAQHQGQQQRSAKVATEVKSWASLAAMRSPKETKTRSQQAKVPKRVHGTQHRGIKSSRNNSSNRNTTDNKSNINTHGHDHANQFEYQGRGKRETKQKENHRQKKKGENISKIPRGGKQDDNYAPLPPVIGIEARKKLEKALLAAQNSHNQFKVQVDILEATLQEYSIMNDANNSTKLPFNDKLCKMPFLAAAIKPLALHLTLIGPTTKKQSSVLSKESALPCYVRCL